MGLVVSPIEPAVITIAGTDLTVPSVYARIYFASNPDGITMSIGYETYVNKAMYVEGSALRTDVPNNSFNAVLDPATQEQTITEALNFAKSGFEQLGYTAVIDPTV